MEEEKVIEFTEEEISMLQSFCQDTLATEPQNAMLATSILEKLSGAESSHIPIKDHLSLKKRGRPRRIAVELPKEILPTPEPETIEAKIETPIFVEEQVHEPQPIAASDNSELTKTVTEQPITTVASNSKLNFLQLLLQKIRPAVRP